MRLPHLTLTLARTSAFALMCAWSLVFMCAGISTNARAIPHAHADTINITSANGETITFLHNDFAGSAIASTDAIGAVLWKEKYDQRKSLWDTPFGDRAVKAVAGANNRQFFTGKPVDSETGLNYFGARYYDPVVGRFMGVDAVGFSPGNLQSFNRYAYANNNPYRFVDPDGNFAIAALYAFGGAAVGLVGYSILPVEDRNRINQALADGFRSAVDMLRHSGDGYLISANPRPVISNSDAGNKSNSVPNLPNGLVGGQDDERAGPNKGGAKHTSGPLKPEFGGTGNFGADLEKLTGGTRPAQPGDKAPPGSLVGANGIFGRPENKSGGSSIDIPANGSKPHETLHY